MDKKLDIYEFIKRHEKNPEIVTGIKVTKVLDTYYYRKIFGRVLGDFFNFIEKHVVGKIVDYYIDYEKVEEAYPENETNTALL